TGEVHGLSSNDYEVSAGRNKHRFFLILQTYFAISDNSQKMQALHLLWRSIPDAVYQQRRNDQFAEKMT
ncbi:hypothetical protein AVEN_27898-1, partial [Araneus ventricosus]